MKKSLFFILTIFLSFFIVQNSFAIEELNEIPLENPETEQEKLEFVPDEPIQKGKIYFDEKDKLKLHLEDHLLKEMKLGVVYYGGLNIDFLQNRSDTSVTYNSYYVDTYINGKFNNDKTSFMLKINPVRHVKGYNYMQTLWQDIWVQHNFNEHQSITAGYYRTPNGEEGSMSSYILNVHERSQIARTFANARATGIKNSGRYKYFDYDIGVFDSARYFDSCFRGFEVVAKATAKPLEFADGKYGHLKLGGSINNGKREYGYTVVNGFASYEYKKFYIDFEYAHADGYNGTYINSNNKAQGLYTTIKYTINPKLALVARCDFFDPNTTVGNDNIDEYTAGVILTPLGPKWAIFINYVFRNDRKNGYSNGILVSTQIMI